MAICRQTLAAAANRRLLSNYGLRLLIRSILDSRETSKSFGKAAVKRVAASKTELNYYCCFCVSKLRSYGIRC